MVWWNKKVLTFYRNENKEGVCPDFNWDKFQKLGAAAEKAHLHVTTNYIYDGDNAYNRVIWKWPFN